MLTDPGDVLSISWGYPQVLANTTPSDQILLYMGPPSALIF